MAATPKWRKLPEPLRKRTQKMAFRALLREEGRPARDQLSYPPYVILSLLATPGATLVSLLEDLLKLLKRRVLVEDEAYDGFVQFDKPANQIDCAAQFLYEDCFELPGNDSEEALRGGAVYITPNVKDQHILRVFKRFLEIANLDRNRLYVLLDEIFVVSGALDEGIGFVNSLEGALGDAARPIIITWRRQMQNTPNPSDIVDSRDKAKLEQIIKGLTGSEMAALWDVVLGLQGKDPQWARQNSSIERFLDNLGMTNRWEQVYWEVHRLKPELRGTHQYHGFPNYVSRRDDREAIEDIIGHYPPLATGNLVDRRSFLEMCGIAHMFTDDDLSGGKQKFINVLFRLADDKVVITPDASQYNNIPERCILGRLLLTLQKMPCDQARINQKVEKLINDYHFGEHP